MRFRRWRGNTPPMIGSACVALVTTLPMEPPASVGVRVRLVIVNGDDAGRELFVDGSVVVGSSETCDLQLHGDPGVSRRHLLVEPSVIGVRVRDQQSLNGTWQGAARLNDAELAEGSEIRVGATILRFERAERAPRTRANPVRTHKEFGRFQGAAPVLTPLYEILERAAQSDATVLLEGESGSGKELLAEAVHERSARRAGPFVVVDCGSVPETLIESELFGHERGAFTGADRARAGAFETANGGTIFLDEIGELPLSMQPRLLRVLDRREVRRIGAAKYIPIDVRFVAATHRNLDREVEAGRFRLDLYYRLAVAIARVPPLRERGDDIELLARHFLKAYDGAPEVLTSEVLGRMNASPWPGNVRELRNHIERLVLLGDTLASVQQKEPSPFAAASSGLPFRRARALALEAFTADYVTDMLARHGGNVSHAAVAAGIARRYFQMLKKSE